MLDRNGDPPANERVTKRRGIDPGDARETENKEENKRGQNHVLQQRLGRIGISP